MRETILVATVGLILTSTASAQSITWDYDRLTDFSRMKTYTWAAGTELEDQLNHKRIIAAVDAQLAAHGLARVESAGTGPDLLVAYHATFDRNVRINAYSTGFAYRFVGSRSTTANVEEILKGTLIVDLIDARTKTIVWRGIASKEIDVRADPAKRDRNINRAAEKLFNRYPPAK